MKNTHIKATETYTHTHIQTKHSDTHKVYSVPNEPVNLLSNYSAHHSQIPHRHQQTLCKPETP